MGVLRKHMGFKQKGGNLGVVVQLLSTGLAPWGAPSPSSSVLPGLRDQAEQGSLSTNRSVIRGRQQLSPGQNKAEARLGGKVLSPGSVQLSGRKAEKRGCRVPTGERRWPSEEESLRMGQSAGRSGWRGAVLHGSPASGWKNYGRQRVSPESPEDWDEL